MKQKAVKSILLLKLESIFNFCLQTSLHKNDHDKLSVFFADVCPLAILKFETLTVFPGCIKHQFLFCLKLRSTSRRTWFRNHGEEITNISNRPIGEKMLLSTSCWDKSWSDNCNSQILQNKAEGYATFMIFSIILTLNAQVFFNVSNSYMDTKNRVCEQTKLQIRSQGI